MSRLLELEALAQDLAKWRGSRAYRRGSKTPAHLKAKALELGPYFKRTDLYKALSISSATFFKWCHEQAAQKPQEDVDTCLPYSRMDLSLVNMPESPELCGHKEAMKEAAGQKNPVLPLASLKCGPISIEFFTTQALVAVCHKLSLGGN